MKNMGEENNPTTITAARSSAANENAGPEATANLISRLFFGWVQPLFRRASDLHKENKALELGDLIALTEADLRK